MKIFSFNVRGLGGHEKRGEVLRVVRDKKPSIMCVEKTKLSVIYDSLCQSLWGQTPCDYSYRSYVGSVFIIDFGALFHY